MARKRHFRKAKRSYFMAKSYRKKSSSMGGLIPTVLGAALYGAVRQKASDALIPITSKIPLGNISDEVLLGALAILGKKTLGRKMPMLNPVFQGAIVIESARIGEAIATGQLGLGMSSSSPTSYTYG